MSPFYLLLFCVAWASAFDMKEVREQMMADEDFVKAKTACMEEYAIDPSELTFGRHGKEERSEKIMCFAKCLQKKRGYLNEDDELDLDKIATLPFFNYVTEEQKTQIIECLQKVGKIEKCEDMKQEAECYHQVLHPE